MNLAGLLVCPICHGSLSSGERFACEQCGAVYDRLGGIPAFLDPGMGAHKREQADWFDHEANPEWETGRPIGAPAFHAFLIHDKFRRATTKLRDRLRGSATLVACGGSGMDAELLAGLGASVVTSDISPGASARAVKRAGLHGAEFDVIVADVERLPFADQSIDFVYVHDGLHHLSSPMDGLAEMARVARVGVCITEPARAAITQVAVKLGLALESEEAGNVVGRLALGDVCEQLRRLGFRIEVAQRYGMYYGHEPGVPARILSLPGVFQLARSFFLITNAVVGRFGNKLVVVAVRE